MDDLDRLFRQLVAALTERGRLGAPFQVAELYQELVPYRVCRTLLGFETHQDYEMALLRLLAGERGYASVEPEAAAETLRLEAEAVDPRTSAVREFAAARARLTPAATREVLAARTAYQPPESTRAPVPESPRPLDAPPPRAEAQPAPRDDLLPEVAPPEERSLVARTAGPREAQAPETHCPYCGQRLPARRVVVYCPFCGGNMRALECPECGTELEEGWLFCITCGKKMGAPSTGGGLGLEASRRRL